MGAYPNNFAFLCPSKRPSRPGQKNRHGAGIWDEAALSSACPLDLSKSEAAAGYRGLAKLGSRDDPMDRTRPICVPVAVRDEVCNLQGRWRSATVGFQSRS